MKKYLITQIPVEWQNTIERQGMHTIIILNRFCFGNGLNFLFICQNGWIRFSTTLGSVPLCSVLSIKGLFEITFKITSAIVTVKI